MRGLQGTRMSATLPLETYRGSVNAWECDENFHMNVRFFAARAMEGLGFVAAALGMPQAFQANATATLAPVDMHVRFLREARMGQPLSMRGGVVDLGDTHVTIYQEMFHADGATAATFITRLLHVHPHDLRAFSFSSRVRTLSEGVRCKIPKHAQPRSIDLTVKPTAPTCAFADTLKAPVVGRLMVSPDHCDAFGRMRMELFLGRVSDAVPNLLAQWRIDAARDAAKDGREPQVGGAVLEYRLCPQRWPRAGELLEVRSGVVEVAEKTNKLVHWLLDPAGGAAWCTAEAVAVTFNLETRKTIPIPPTRRATLEAMSIPGMTI